jgi:uncharacterized membrane protein
VAHLSNISKVIDMTLEYFLSWQGAVVIYI